VDLYLLDKLIVIKMTQSKIGGWVSFLRESDRVFGFDDGMEVSVS